MQMSVTQCLRTQSYTVLYCQMRTQSYTVILILTFTKSINQNLPNVTGSNQNLTILNVVITQKHTRSSCSYAAAGVCEIINQGASWMYDVITEMEMDYTFNGYIC